MKRTDIMHVGTAVVTLAGYFALVIKGEIEFDPGWFEMLLAVILAGAGIDVSGDLKADLSSATESALNEFREE